MKSLRISRSAMGQRLKKKNCNHGRHNTHIKKNMEGKDISLLSSLTKRREKAPRDCLFSGRLSSWSMDTVGVRRTKPALVATSGAMQTTRACATPSRCKARRLRNTNKKEKRNTSWSEQKGFSGEGGEWHRHAETPFLGGQRLLKADIKGQKSQAATPSARILRNLTPMRGRRRGRTENGSSNVPKAERSWVDQDARRPVPISTEAILQKVGFFRARLGAKVPRMASRLPQKARRLGVDKNRRGQNESDDSGWGDASET